MSKLSKTEKVVKWFFVAAAALIVILMIQGIGQVPFASYPQLLIGAAVFYVFVMALLNYKQGKKLFADLFRLW